MVLRYELVCEHSLELIVPADQVDDRHVLGDIRVWCPSCHVEQQVVRVHMDSTR